ncbi:hypothetical protein J2S74_005422 [Evansella vedderi]|uniref:Uncharacterized protein n=1 Tax=Evansella vedderi TaxID=38282 RepID=A0ABU0A394_9BACI|nr:hypothetical protein [Evansella vedderi]MDQ0257959.1 hypothetical protein [Evansella vedderi]
MNIKTSELQLIITCVNDRRQRFKRELEKESKYSWSDEIDDLKVDVEELQNLQTKLEDMLEEKLKG